MSEPLITYLNDHLGGAQVALEVLISMRDHNDNPRFRDLAARLVPEVQSDDHTLQTIVDKVGSHPSVVKKAGGWLLERLTRLKLEHTGSVEFGLFESLELLVNGIHGKICLWKALQAASEHDPRLQGYDFADLIARGQSQYDEVESHRIDLARTLL